MFVNLPQNQLLGAIFFPILAYLLGSLTFSLWITRWIKGVDVRDAGSGHATTTNTIRQVGWLPGILVFLLDVGKGFLPTFLAIKFNVPIWGVAITASMAVIGHCWPLYAGFRGGMGLATAGGAILAVSPFSFLLSFALLIGLLLTIRHAARASLITGILLTPYLYLFGQRGQIIWMAAFVGFILAVRFTIDWRREYRELWLDRELEKEGE